MHGRHRAVPLPGVAHRGLQRFGESDQRVRDVWIPGTLPGDDDRVLCSADALEYLLEIGCDLCRWRRCGRGRSELACVTLEEVAGYLDVGRAGAAGDRQRECVSNGSLDVGGAGHAT